MRKDTQVSPVLSIEMNWNWLGWALFLAAAVSILVLI
jgi:hypothetical protein